MQVIAASARSFYLKTVPRAVPILTQSQTPCRQQPVPRVPRRSASSKTCGTCNATFSSGNVLYRHLKECGVARGIDEKTDTTDIGELGNDAEGLRARGTEPTNFTAPSHQTAQASSTSPSADTASKTSDSPHKWTSPPIRASGKLCQGRRILLTGGTSGIGLAVAERLLAEGVSHITILTRKKWPEVKPTFLRLTSIAGADAAVNILNQFDITNLQQVEKDIPKILVGGECDTVISCAGIAQAKGILNVSEDDVESILRTNLTASMAIARIFLRTYFKTFNYGKARKRLRPEDLRDEFVGPFESGIQALPSANSRVFVAVSSLLATQGGHGTSIYAASKAGLEAFVRALSGEAGHMYRRLVTTASPQSTAEHISNVPPFRANIVRPGYVATPMLQNFTPQYAKGLQAKIPLRRFATPEEVADAVVFCVANEYANNTVLNVDGGMSAGFAYGE
ncbi:3-oxoacyl-[acyl-carrier-protein] [Cyphellophora attinorum]|uniref:3-oxoacyl-[acyl-carrier-protein] n=1 Tax=Cyphellophora attinorum TaxID=1664694 RepID=A0A0N1H1B7_9EURO|nr:3-oxoacyl-[acyl-carrier-protein] [Phialophora attinorum]KPI38093.1 3-oxoacyl-[acyl-carrier-protein] [Phialophora attinorum]